METLNKCAYFCIKISNCCWEIGKNDKRATFFDSPCIYRCRNLSRYASSHLGQLSLAIPLRVESFIFNFHLYIYLDSFITFTLFAVIKHFQCRFCYLVVCMLCSVSSTYTGSDSRWQYKTLYHRADSSVGRWLTLCFVDAIVSSSWPHPSSDKTCTNQTNTPCANQQSQPEFSAVLPRTRSKFDERGFHISGPAAWKAVPTELHDVTVIIS